MRLILLRHGPAGERDPIRWPDDRDRPLTDKGIARTDQVLRGLRAAQSELSLVLTSPLVRAAQTAARAGEAFDSEVRTLEALAPGGSWRAALKALQELPPRNDAAVLLVGHEPDLGKLAGVLLFGAPHGLPLRKAGACRIDCTEAPAPGNGELVWFAPPRLLRTLSRRKARA